MNRPHQSKQGRGGGVTTASIVAYETCLLGVHLPRCSSFAAYVPPSPFPHCAQDCIWSCFASSPLHKRAVSAPALPFILNLVMLPPASHVQRSSHPLSRLAQLAPPPRPGRNASPCNAPQLDRKVVRDIVVVPVVVPERVEPGGGLLGVRAGTCLGREGCAVGFLVLPVYRATQCKQHCCRGGCGGGVSPSEANSSNSSSSSSR